MDALISQIYFWNKTLHVSDSSSVHHQEFFNVHTAIVQQDQDGTAVPSWSCSQAVSRSVWRIPLLCVEWKTPDDGQRNCPKHVEFYFKNKFEKLVHLVGFIIRIYLDARSPERQNQLKEWYDNVIIFCLLGLSHGTEYGAVLESWLRLENYEKLGENICHINAVHIMCG